MAVTTPVPDATEKLFTEKQRGVFKYHNGVKEVWGDPLQIFRRLEYALQGGAIALIRQAFLPPPKYKPPSEEGPDRDSYEQTYGQLKADYILRTSEAKERLVPAVRQAFGMPPLVQDIDKNPEGKGATEEDCLNAIEAWVRYQDAKKKNTAS